MRILTVSDKVEPVLYGPYIRERVGQIDLILACGDLPYYYLEYIVSLLDRPLYYVHGNHDKAILRATDLNPMPGAAGLGWGVNLHTHTACHQGLLLAGFEGCRVYNPGALYQYSESQVQGQTLALGLRLLANRLRYGRYLDILITHAPPRGIHDRSTQTHTGIDAFLWLMDVFQPRYLLHGHTHRYRQDAPAVTRYKETEVINVYPYRVLEWKG